MATAGWSLTESLANGGVALLWGGVVMGFAIAAPLGPVNVEIIRRGLGEGFRAALLTGVGSTIADVVYILIAYGGADPLSRRQGAGRLLFSAGALGIRELAGIGNCEATPTRETTWGRIKSLY